MAAETLNFGPEWLRALSSGGSVASPPPSPAMPKYKLADYRYGREEMLALYVKESKVPDELQDKEFAALLQEEPLQPLALEPLTEEEQRNFSLSVNSVAVLRLMGKGAGPPLGGASRGRGSTRSRGRGRGDSCFYQRSIEEEARGGLRNRPGEMEHAPGLMREGLARGRSMPAQIAKTGVLSERSKRKKRKAAGDSGQDPGETVTAGAPPALMVAPALLAGGNMGTGVASLNLICEGIEEGVVKRRGGVGGGALTSGGAGGLTASMMTRMGSRSGAWTMRTKKWAPSMPPGPSCLSRYLQGDKGEILLEVGGHLPASKRGSFHGTLFSATHLPVVSPRPMQKGPKEPIPEEQELDFQGLEEEEEEPSEGLDEEGPEAGGKELTPLPPQEEKSSSPSPLPTLGPLWGANGEGDDPVEKDLPAAEGGREARGLPAGQLPGGGAVHGRHPGPGPAPLCSRHCPPPQPRCGPEVVLQGPAGRDPSCPSLGPGPFTTQEMAEWFQAGYFSMALLVKRGCDEGFQPLGEVIKMWGRVPFAPGPSPPPLLGNMDQERLKKQQELAAAALYQQLQHQQFLQLVGSSRQLPQCVLREKAALGDLPPPQQQQLTAFLQQLQALKPPRGGDQNLLPTMNRSLSVPDSGPLWDIHTSASPQSGGEASLWDIPINSSTQGPILEQLQLQHKFQERREVELRVKREEEERKRREEKRRQQQQQQEEQKRRQEEEELFRRKQVGPGPPLAWGGHGGGPHSGFSLQARQQELLLKLLQQQQAVAAVPAPPAPSSPPPLWAGLAKQGLSMKTLLELQLEGERHLHKQPPPREPSRAQAPNHRVQLGGLGSAPLNQWVSEAGPLWGGPDKSGGSSSLGLWEDTLKSSGSLARSLGLKNSRSSPSLSDSYSHLSGRPVRKKTEEEEKLLKLLQGIPRPQDGFTQWCEQMLHTLSTTGSLDVPMAVAILKEVESPYDVHDYIRSCLGDTLEAKEFAKQFLERRAKQKASQQRQQQQEAWLSSGSLQTAFQTNHSTKLGPGEGSKAKRRALMLHSDPSILGYSLHGPSGEIESVDDY
nr:GRB10-interacting GYF protein 1 isoform X8 [Bubalus bubalis]